MTKGLKGHWKWCGTELNWRTLTIQHTQVLRWTGRREHMLSDNIRPYLWTLDGISMFNEFWKPCVELWKTMVGWWHLWWWWRHEGESPTTQESSIVVQPQLHATGSGKGIVERHNLWCYYSHSVKHLYNIRNEVVLIMINISNMYDINAKKYYITWKIQYNVPCLSTPVSQ